MFVAQPITDAQLHGIQTVQHIQRGHAEARDAAVEHGATCHHRIEPTTATRPPRGSAELGAYAPQVLAHVIEQLGRERARTHACRVRLDDADDAVDVRRTDTRTRGCGAGGRIRRGHEGIGTVIHIQQGALRTFE